MIDLKHHKADEINYNNPLESIHDCIVFSCRDWAKDKRSAWIYGIVVGWDSDSYEEMMEKFKWSEEEVKRNIVLHGIYAKLWKEVQ